jgi:tetratricopeptide (TPR) repeat protein
MNLGMHADLKSRSVTNEATLVAYAQRLLQLRRWSDARTALQQLAVMMPQTSRYRALLALARGHEAADAGELARARTEWTRAITLDPTLEDAHLALSKRRNRPTLIGRMFGRR